MAVELVTGYSGTEHVSSSDDGARQAGTVGTGMYVLETVEDPLTATLENANTVTVGPGDVLINGRHVRLTGSTTFAVPVGTQAMQTSNLLVLRYSVSDDGTEKVEAVTLTGEPAASDPQDPTLATGSVLDGDSPVDMPLYRVVTTGIESAQPVKLFSTIPPISGLPGVGENVLDVAHGGTGMTSEPSLLVNLGSTSPASAFQESPRPGVTGTLPVARGGTGATSAAAARRALKAPAVAGPATDASISCDYNYDQRVMTQVSGPGGVFMTVAADGYFGLYHNTAQSWLWQLWPNDPTKGLLQAGRGNVSNLSRDTLYGLAPGTYLVANNATNGPESGSYGNLLVSYSAGSRIVGLLAYDNGHVYATYGASASGTFLWTRLDNGAYGKLLWSGSWSSGKVTIPGVNQYRVLAASAANFEDRLVGVNTGNGTISLFANGSWGDDSATDMAVLACRLTREGSTETLRYDSGGRVNLGNYYSYGYGVINSVWGVA